MLFQVGGQGSRPTFFEMVAAQQLPSSLRAALAYSVGVLAQRRPFLHKVLDYEDECFALLMLVLDAHSLRTADASFAESLYGLKRKAVKISTNVKSTSHHVVSSDDPIQHSGLKKGQKVLSLAFLVLFPYLKSKLNLVYTRHRDLVLQAALWGSADAGLNTDDHLLQEEQLHHRTEDADVEGSHLSSTTIKLKKILAVLYPWIHALNEGFSFAYQLSYLLDATGFYTPALHVLGVHVCRATGQELFVRKSLDGPVSLYILLRWIHLTKIVRNRSREYERLRGPAWLKVCFHHFYGIVIEKPNLCAAWLKTVQRILLKSAYAALDYAQTGLIAAVFFFKMMEWWYQSAEERMSAPTVYPPPPPPPPPKIAEGGISLPSNRSLCPLCRQKRANPSVISCSGFVFCYACIFRYVSQYKRCPVTLMPITVDQIRRLFQDT